MTSLTQRLLSDSSLEVTICIIFTARQKNAFITKCSLNSTNKIPHTETIPTLSGYFPNKIDNAEVSTAAPPIADVALSMKETVMNASRSTIRSQNLKDTKATDTSWFKKLKSLKEQNLEFEQFLLFGEIRRARIQKISGKKQWCREPLEWGARKKEHTPKNSNSLTSALRSQHKNIIGYRVVICQQLVIRINAIQRSRLIMADGLQVFDNSFWNQGILRRLKLFLLERTFFQCSIFRKISDCRSFTYLRTVTGSTPHSVNFHGSEFWAQCKSSVRHEIFESLRDRWRQFIIGSTQREKFVRDGTSTFPKYLLRSFVCETHPNWDISQISSSQCPSKFEIVQRSWHYPSVATTWKLTDN